MLDVWIKGVDDDVLEKLAVKKENDKLLVVDESVLLNGTVLSLDIFVEEFSVLEDTNVLVIDWVVKFKLSVVFPVVLLNVLDVLLEVGYVVVWTIIVVKVEGKSLVLDSVVDEIEVEITEQMLIIEWMVYVSVVFPVVLIEQLIVVLIELGGCCRG